MKKEIIGKILTVAAMACLTFIFAALSKHYDVFAFGFRSDSVPWPELLIFWGVIILVGLIGIGFLYIADSRSAVLLLLMPFEIWDNISEKHGKRQHLINVFLLVLCVAFVVYTTNLVTILEHLSGEHYCQMPTFGGFLAVLYAWVILFGTLIVFGWLSGLSDAHIKYCKKCAEIEKNLKAEQQKTERKREKRRRRRARKKQKIQLEKLTS
ncbi:MAG: hypothetical protein IJ770_05720 [Alphaproteobacteria bacterium]|nr:hypothetical protein [Alphaproteobacteria bacterium]